MDCENKNIPLAVILTAAIIGGVVASVYVYNSIHKDANGKIRDAQEIIEQCRKQIKKIETDAAERMEVLKKEHAAA